MKSCLVLTVLLVFVLLAVGCGHFVAQYDPKTGYVSFDEQSTNVLINKTAGKVFYHEWIDEDGVPHEVRISSDVKEDSMNQWRVLDRAIGLAEKSMERDRP